jgi:glycosyltransferase involved in cell wall biosynthesis
VIADTAQDFADAVLKILDDRPFGDELGKAGRKLIQEKYDYRKVCAQLELVYQIHENQSV